MSSPRKSGMLTQKSLTRQATKAGDPWCLTCGVNLALDGRTFTVLSLLHHGDLCEMFPRVLGVEFSEQYPSVNLCNRCERQLRRLGRYSSIILARHEGQKLRDQLVKNLAKHGTTAVESGESLDIELAAANEEPITATTKRNVSSPRQIRKGQSVDGSSPPKRREFSSISPTRKNRKPVSAIEEGAEPPFDHEGARRQGSHTGAARRRESPTKDYERRSGSASQRVKTRPGERPATVSPIPGEGKFATKARGIALVKRATTTPRDAQKVDHRPQVAPKPRKPRSINATSKRSQEDQETKEAEYQHSGSTPDRFDEADVEMASNGDRKALVERSESVDHEKPREKLKVKRFFSLGFLNNNDKDSNSKTEGDSPVDGTNASEQNLEDSKADGDQDKTNGEADTQDPHWAKRVNPFDGEGPESRVPGSLEVPGSVVDAEVHPDDHAKQSSMARTVSEQADEELFNVIDKTKFDASGSETDSEEEKVDPSDYNADTRSNLSEVEERINIKSQFRGAYYNIGSTEDLLAELASEQEADKARLAKLKSKEGTETDEQSKSEKGHKSSKDKSRQKGKLTQYESLDLDIDNSNPFFDDVYSEYNRRVTAKNKTQTSKAPRVRPRNPDRPATIKEADHSLDGANGEERPHYVSTSSIVFMSASMNGTAEGVQNSTTRSGKAKTRTDVDADGSRPEGGNNQDNAPLINSAEDGGEFESNAAEEEIIAPSQADGTQSAPGDASGDQAATQPAVDGAPASGDQNASEDATASGTLGDQASGEGGAGDSADTADGAEKGEVITDSEEPSVTIGQTKEGKPRVTFALETSAEKVEEEDSQRPQTEDGPIKSEKSPLIGSKKGMESGELNVQKDSKFKDQQPGFLCCTIL